MVKARMNLIAELGKQYGASQPIADGKPVPFETWAEPMLRAAGLGQAAETACRQGWRSPQGLPIQGRQSGRSSQLGEGVMAADQAQRKAGTIYTLADGRRVNWDGTGATEVI
jgi:hypothetical protein